jgi:hypothetical protein
LFHGLLRRCSPAKGPLLQSGAANLIWRAHHFDVLVGRTLVDLNSYAILHTIEALSAVFSLAFIGDDVYGGTAFLQHFFSPSMA